ncbi:MAG TPA: hypothetical protein VFS22_08490 [Flavisolibacter sp.]|nr:hypothetical protein [Flavisolibacter sp.]
MKTILLPLLSLASLLTLNSCTKEDTVRNEEEIIGTWAIVGISSDIPNDWDYDGYEETDIYNTYTYCQKDISLSFDYSGYGQARQGCDAPYETLRWQLSNNRLDISIPSGDINLYITQFNDNTIRGYDQVQVNGRSYDITYTLSKRY